MSSDSARSCKHCVDHLFDYLEGTLAAEEERAMDEHFARCEPCMDFVDQYRGASTLCRRAIAGEMPKALADQLGEYLHKKIRS